MERQNEKRPRRRSLRLAARLFGTSVVAQLAVLAALALAAARTSPDDFAMFGAISAASAILASINTLAAENRSPVVSDDDCQRLTRAGAAIASALFAVCLTIGAAGHLAGEDWSLPVALTGLCSWLIASQQLLSGVILRIEKQELLARYRFVQGVSNAVLIVGLIWLTIPAYLALTFAWSISLAIGSISTWKGVPPESQRLGRAQLSDLRLLISQVRLVPLANLMATAASQMPVLALQATGAASVTGAWALVYRFLAPAVNTSFSTLQPLYYGRAAGLARVGRLSALSAFHRRWTVRLSLASILVIAAFAIFIWFGIPQLGTGWNVSRMVIVPACVHFAALFICLPLSQTLLLLGRVDLQFVWTVVRFTLCAVPLAGMAVMGPMLALTLWSVASCATYLLLILLQRLALRPSRTN